MAIDVKTPKGYRKAWNGSPVHHADEFAEWRYLRPDKFLEHATRATSQYDEQYRSMSAEILALRRFRDEALSPSAGEAPSEASVSLDSERKSED